MNEKTYREHHARLLRLMREQIQLKNYRAIQRTGQRLHRLRRRYRKRFLPAA